MARSALSGVRCLRCDRPLPSGVQPFGGCPSCSESNRPANWTTLYDLDAARRTFTPARLAARPPGLWRYAELLPVPATCDVTLGEGATPLLPAPRLARRLGLREVWVKDESRNPTWSFKDRAAAVAATHAGLLGSRGLVVASTGNAGAATAAYARRVGLPVLVLASTSLDPLMASFIQAYGALVVAVPAKADRWTLMARCVQDWGYYPNSNYANPPVGNNPYAIDGYKTIAYEIWEQLGYRVPDWVFLPTGYGDGLYGVYKGFRELHAMGLVDNRPRMGAAEIYGSLTRTLAAGKDVVEPSRVDWETVAFSIAPVQSTYQALVAIRDSGGAVSQVTDSAVLAAQRWLAEDEGMYAETAAAAAVAALVDAMQRGAVSPDARVVVVNTSAGFKSAGAVPPPPGGLPVVEPVSLERLASVLSVRYGWVATTGSDN